MPETAVPDAAREDADALRRDATRSMTELAREAEAILFSLGTEADTARLATALELDRTRLEEVLESVESLLVGHGLMLQRQGTTVQMVTRPEVATAVRRVLNPEVPARLSPAAYETLAIIAYRQPVTKAAIEEVRGVDCERVLEGRLGRGLVEEVGRLEQAGTPRLFGTTMRFLQLLGLARLEDLPGLRD